MFANDSIIGLIEAKQGDVLGIREEIGEESDQAR